MTDGAFWSIFGFLKQADLYISEGLHPRIVTEGFEEAKKVALETLENMKITLTDAERKDILTKISSTSLLTKVHPTIAKNLTDICVEAVESIKPAEGSKEIDLHMVEIMEMQHRAETETTLVKGLVMDHGGRHPDMPKRLENCHILTCNVSMEYEKTEVNSGFFYKSADEREKLVAAERQFIEDRVQKVIEFKKKVCDGTDKTFVIINQKGIDPLSLDALAREGILALRRYNFRSSIQKMKSANDQESSEGKTNKLKSFPIFALASKMCLPYARHYKPRLVYFLPHFQRPFLCF